MKDSVVPAYYRVEMDILEKIKQDIYKVGELLPSDMEFCKIYDTSRITVRRALSDLENEGYIVRMQGKGTFVKFKEIKQNMSKFYSFTDETIKMGFIPSSIFINLSLVDANDKLKQILDLEDGDKLFLLERLRLADEKIVAYDRSYIPEKIIPGFKKELLNCGSLYNAIENNYGFRPNNSEETIEAIEINEDDALKMRVKKNSAMLLVKRVSYYNNQKVEYNYRIVNSKLYKYKVKLS